MFVTDQDYSVVIGESALRVISQVSDTVRSSAEAHAQEEISGYLRPQYDVQTIFSQEGEQRNSLIVMYTCDIALYHMSAALPQKMGSEVRRERYEDALKWLAAVQQGKIVPDLPLTVNEEGEVPGMSARYGCQPKQHNNW